LGPALVGVYFVAVQVAERLWLPSKVISTVLLPRMAELHAHADTRELTPLMSRLVLWGTVAACLAVAVIAAPALRLLFGHEFLGAVQPLLWLLPGIALAGGSRIVANDFAARGRPEWNSWLSVVTLVVNVAGNVALIPRYGITGAAVATTIAYTVNTVARMFIYTRVAGVPWHEQVFLRRSDLRLVASAVRLGGNAVAGRVRRG
ncbi:MAG TPA: polysaccharide biosynthesis C-terminal domain-containing protein, partial [Desulfobacterales bacterium]|nr:polysaccharide biosynthesis C-terminal domain-containing protein [Desulfobacterales bacterium]